MGAARGARVILRHATDGRRCPDCWRLRLHETYAYDPLGRLQTVNNGVTTRFIYVGLSNSVAEEVDGSGNVLSKHATDLAGTELFDFTGIAGTNVAYLGRNAHGDVTYTYNGAGTISSTAAYDPFGNVIATSGSQPSITDSGWQGSWFDARTHLYYVVARWYSPALGQFLSDDPLTADAANPQARDPYAFGAGDPVDKVDPSGLDPRICTESAPCGGSFDPAAVQYYSQNAPQLNQPNQPGYPLGGAASGCKDSFARSGCFLTSVAMILNYYGVMVRTGANTRALAEPLTLNEALNYIASTTTHKLIGSSCGLAWSSTADSGRFRHPIPLGFRHPIPPGIRHPIPPGFGPPLRRSPAAA